MRTFIIYFILGFFGFNINLLAEKALNDYEESFEILKKAIDQKRKFLDVLPANEWLLLVNDLKPNESVKDFKNFLESFPAFLVNFQTLRSYTEPKREINTKLANLANAKSGLTKEALAKQKDWYLENLNLLLAIEEKTSVNAEILAAIYYAETKLSNYKLPNLLYAVLFTQIAYLENGILANESQQVDRLKRLKRLARASLLAFYRFSKNKAYLDLTKIRSSWAGAAGPMQLMPFNFHFLEDGNQNGFISPDEELDSLYGAARFLVAKGYSKTIFANFLANENNQDLLAIILRYNANQAYANGVIESAHAIREAVNRLPLNAQNEVPNYLVIDY